MGAIDGKHEAICQPQNSGSECFSYKGLFSILLSALVDADYKFLYVNAGLAGRKGDAGIFQKSALKKAMEKKLAGFPEANISQSH